MSEIEILRARVEQALKACDPHRSFRASIAGPGGSTGGMGSREWDARLRGLLLRRVEIPPGLDRPVNFVQPEEAEAIRREYDARRAKAMGLPARDFEGWRDHRARTTRAVSLLYEEERNEVARAARPERGTLRVAMAILALLG